jgi:ABC-type Fe3+-siderophore transport system permease subunit
MRHDPVVPGVRPPMLTPVTLLIVGVLISYIADSAARLLIILAPMSHKSIFTGWNEATALIGALLGLIADLATSLPGAQQVLHVNHATAIVGGPVLLWMLLSRRESREMQFQ